MELNDLSVKELYALRESVDKELTSRNNKKREEDYSTNLQYIGKCYKLPLINGVNHCYSMVIAPMLNNQYRFYTLSFEYPIVLKPSEELEFNYTGVYIDDLGLLTFEHNSKAPFTKKIYSYKKYEISKKEFYKALDNHITQLKELLNDKKFNILLKE